MDCSTNGPLQHARQWDDDCNEWGSGWAPTFDLLDPANVHFHLHQTDTSSVQRYLRDTESPWFNVGAPMISHFESLAIPPFPTMVLHTHDVNQRTTSPSNSGPSSVGTHSGWNDEQSTPWSSPGPSTAEFSPHLRYAEPMLHTNGGGVASECARVVSMGEIQGYPDDQPDQARFDDEQFVHYTPTAEEGYHPRTMAMDEQPNGRDADTSASTLTNTQPPPPNAHRRRDSAVQAVNSPTTLIKVTKRPSRRRQTSSSSSRSNSRLNGVVDTPSSKRSFPCLFVNYGCQSTFGTKNEWKRHVFTQHMRTGFWRCDQCDTSDDRKPNEFNRKDLFIQHIRRMHPLAVVKANNAKPSGPRSQKKDPEDRQLSDIAQRCYHKTRSLPDECGCHFCDARFSGTAAWEERMEHVGGHMETTKKENAEAADPQTWLQDKLLEDYLKREHIIELKGKRYIIAESQK